MIRAVLLVAAASASAAGAQPVPYRPLPPGAPAPLQPVVSIPMLQADLAAKAGSDTVRFQRDAYAIDPTAQAVLAIQAQWLIQHPRVRASIEGHADVRQPRDYALALGERRAAAVRNFLLAQGVPPQQLSIVSWGRERPSTPAIHDATWLQNSRVVTVLKDF